MRRAAILAGLLALSCVLSPALAHERPHGPQTPAPGSGTVRQAQTAPECYCRARGRRFAPGETACLQTPQGARLAECRMIVNVMSWGFTEQPCPDS